MNTLPDTNYEVISRLVPVPAGIVLLDPSSGFNSPVAASMLLWRSADNISVPPTIDELMEIDTFAKEHNLVNPVCELLGAIALRAEPEDPWQAYDPSRNTRVINTGNLTILPDVRSVEYNNIPVRLTPSEFNLLMLLVNNNGTMMPTNEICLALKCNEKKLYTPNIVSTHLYNVRKKFAEYGTLPIISQYGQGILWDETVTKSLRELKRVDSPHQ